MIFHTLIAVFLAQFFLFLSWCHSLFLYPNVTLNINFLRIMQQQKHTDLLNRISGWEEISAYLIWFPLVTSQERDPEREGTVTSCPSHQSPWLVHHSFACSAHSRGLVFAEVRAAPKLSPNTESTIALRVGGRKEHTQQLATDPSEVRHSALARTAAVLLISPQSPHTSTFFIPQVVSAGNSRWENINNHCSITVPTSKPKLANFHPRDHTM